MARRTRVIVAVGIGTLVLAGSAFYLHHVLERRALSAELQARYPGYSWPVSTGCTQIASNRPNFANNSRLRPDGTTRAHLGIDIVPPRGDLRVFAAMEGIVTASSPARGNGWGNHVILRHEDGLSTVYAHLVTPSKLRAGSRVSKGDVIGLAGQTETYFVHLHFEMHGKETSGDWTRGRLDPLLVIGELSGCENSSTATR